MPAVMTDTLERLRRAANDAAQMVGTAAAEPGGGAGGGAGADDTSTAATDGAGTKSKLDNVKDALMKQLEKLPRESIGGVGGRNWKGRGEGG